MRAATIALLIALTLTGVAQNSPSQPISASHFRWSKRKAQELDYDHTLRKSRELSRDQKIALLEAVAAQIRPFRKNLEIGSERELREVVGDTRIKLLDLNGDGTAEILVQAFGLKAGCGATGNCSFWVFQKAGTGFKKILDSRGENRDGIGGIELYTVYPSRTEGFNDLVLAAHDSASEKTLFMYRYGKGQYRLSECYVATWISTEGNKWRELKYPEIGLISCK